MRRLWWRVRRVWWALTAPPNAQWLSDREHRWLTGREVR